MVLIILHQSGDTDTIIKAYLSAIKLPGKSKFKHFLYDLSLRIAIAATFFTLCLFTSLMFPLTTLFATIFFLAAVSFHFYQILVNNMFSCSTRSTSITSVLSTQWTSKARALTDAFSSFNRFWQFFSSRYRCLRFQQFSCRPRTSPTSQQPS